MRPAIYQYFFLFFGGAGEFSHRISNKAPHLSEPRQRIQVRAAEKQKEGFLASRFL
jgi:hypothetical protein